MRILICGIDGYIGWPLALRLKAKGYEIVGIDNCWRRGIAKSAIPIGEVPDRFHKNEIEFYRINVGDIAGLKGSFSFDTIVHLAEQPSAAWSMESLGNCLSTHYNNLSGTLSLLWFMKEKYPDAHLVKLGTMGEYGTPSCAIPENDPDFPKRPGSFYHATKVHDSVNIRFACGVWGLSATDIMQGVVYGTGTEETLTRFDYDECFGTVLNRFCAQAVAGMPLTVYGSGEQERSFLSLADSIECIALAIENPVGQGEYRMINQFHKVYSIKQLAETVSRETGVPAIHIDSPRVEADRHMYEPVSEVLKSFGYRPTQSLERDLKQMISDLGKYGDNIDIAVLGEPRIRWK